MNLNTPCGSGLPAATAGYENNAKGQSACTGLLKNLLRLPSAFMEHGVLMA